MNLLDIPTFYINLDKDIYRRVNVQSKLIPIGFTHLQRFSGIEGITDKSYGLIDLHQTHKRYPFISYKTFKGLVGCATSHLSIIRYQIQHSLPFVTIFEDDIEIRKDIFNCLIEDVRQQYHGWDILFWGTYNTIYGTLTSVGKVLQYNGRVKMFSGLHAYTIR